MGRPFSRRADRVYRAPEKRVHSPTAEGGMTISLEHDRLKADLQGAATALGVKVVRNDSKRASLTGRMDRQRVLVVGLPKPTQVHARFVREGLLERAKKLFV